MHSYVINAHVAHSRLAAEADKNRQLQDAINKLQGALAGKEKEAADLRACCEHLKRELDGLKPNSAKLSRDNEELQRRWDSCTIECDAFDHSYIFYEVKHFQNRYQFVLKVMLVNLLHRLADECKRRQDAEEKAKQLCDKLNFDSQKAGQVSIFSPF